MTCGFWGKFVNWTVQPAVGVKLKVGVGVGLPAVAGNLVVSDGVCSDVAVVGSAVLADSDSAGADEWVCGEGLGVVLAVAAALDCAVGGEVSG